MMGETPPAFDLLYWNGDGTNLPAKMAVEYLRGLCQRDELAQGKYPVFGEPVDLSDIRIPIMAIACETDHIAAWKSSLNGIRRFGSPDKTFVVSQSGHIAGIVNPPAKNKYGHYTRDGALVAPDEWLAAATFNQGSWWPRWRDWLIPRSGEQVKARVPGDSSHPVLGPAPGTYVTAVPST
jgi:polyhydroxyalkanoate synthase